MDYRRVRGRALSAQYHSFSSRKTIAHDGRRWRVADEHGNVVAHKESAAPFPNAMRELDLTPWTLSGGEPAPFLSVHCEVPSKAHYVSKLRAHFERASADGELAHFENAHFSAVVLSEDVHFGMTDDLRYFTWNDSMSAQSVKMPSVGIGTAGISNDAQVIEWAVNESGYELIDSASDHAPWYQNEHIIANLLRREVLKRDSVMVTTKLYAQDQGLTVSPLRR